MAESPSELQVRKPDPLVPRVLAQRREAPPAPQHSSLNRNDIVFALFKHKKKIVLAALVGFVAAGAVYFLYPPVYQSRAKLLVRYVVERSSVDPIDPGRGSLGLGREGPNVLASEVEILTSWDLAVQVAEAIGPKRLFPKSEGTPSKESAAGIIAGGLEVTVPKGSNIIFVSYKSSEPEIATLVLSELVNRYFNKHLEVHRSAGAFDFVSQQTDQVRARLNQTEDALKDLKEKAGVLSLENSTTALSTEAAKSEEQLHLAEADLAEQQARVRQLGGTVTGASITSESSKPAEAGTADTPAEKANEAPAGALQQYQVLASRLPKLRETNLELLAKYTPENQVVRANEAEIDEVEKQALSLAKKYPDLPARVGPIVSSKSRQLDPASETAHLAGLQAKKDSLTARLHNIQQRIQQFSQLGPQIANLERQRQVEEANYKYFQATLEKARIDEALDPSKIPNISAVQRPSPPFFDTTRRDKIILALAGGGLALGVVFALLKELILNRSVRRPVEIERVVGVSPLLSIPYSPKLKNASGSLSNGKVNALVPKGASAKNLAPWDTSHFIRPYCEAIRDRIGLYFELHQLTHKPKLVGVAGFSEAAGASTLAAGLAAALSQTGDGKVLLVDVNLGPEEVHPFFRGRPAYSLKTALQPASAIDSAAENLYLASVGSGNSGPAQLGLKKFFDLMPNMRASDFDYIIFDMPPLGQITPTLGMAGFMDKFLLIVEAEQNNRDVVRRGYSSLVGIRNNVSVVLNKTRSYTPKWLDLQD
jgi:polysaccharide biosynthesis transport protein